MAGFIVDVDPVDNITPSYGTIQGTRHCGAYEYDGNLFLLSGEASDPLFRVYKSTDRGRNWAEIAEGTGPGGSTLVQDYREDGIVHTARFEYVGGLWRLYYRTFNLATETWSADASPAWTKTTPNIRGIIARSTGEVVILMTYKDGAAFNQLWYTKYNGASWTVPIAMTDGTYSFSTRAPIGTSNDAVHAFWYYVKDAKARLGYRQLTAADALSPDQDAIEEVKDVTWVGEGVDVDTQVLIPIFRYKTGSSNLPFSVLVGTPYTDQNPVWTIEDIPNAGALNWYDWVRCKVEDGKPVHYGFFLVAPNNTQLRRSVRDGGVWQPFEALWDDTWEWDGNHQTGLPYPDDRTWMVTQDFSGVIYPSWGGRGFVGKATNNPRDSEHTYFLYIPEEVPPDVDMLAGPLEFEIHMPNVGLGRGEFGPLIKTYSNPIPCRRRMGL